MQHRAWTVTALATLAVPAFAQAPVGTEFTYQGRLMKNGSPADGMHDLRFRLYDADLGGAQYGPAVCVDNVAVSDGLFTVALDFGAQFYGSVRYLEVDARSDSGLACDSSAGFVTLGPRQLLNAVPQAMHALQAIKASDAETLDGFDSTAFLKAIPVPLTLSSGITGHIILGQNSSAADTASGVYGRATAGFGQTRGVEGRSDSTIGTGVRGFASTSTGTNYGVVGETASTAGRGVFGRATAATGTTIGVEGIASSAQGIGVKGYAPASTSSSYGVWAESNSYYGAALYARNNGSGYGISVSSDWSAVYGSGGSVGVTGSSPNMGVWGHGGSAAESIGVYGDSGSTSGYGVYGRSNDNIGTAGYAVGTSGLNFGVYGESASTSGRAIYGVATSSSGTTYAVRGWNGNAAGYGLFSVGNLGCSGTKAFVIDHPLDPQNKYLKHYCAEGPEPLNIYGGVVQLDGQGQATIDLPAYFAEINRDPRIQLTAAGASMPGLFASETIADNRFQVGGGRPNGKVYWRVEAVRNDVWMRTHGAPVEVEKDAVERGKYQHAELYAQPPEMGIDNRPEIRGGDVRPSPEALRAPPPESSERP